MIPKFGEVSEAEELAASEVPSFVGAWWIMLQTAESICNYASGRDPVNNAFLDEFWQEAADQSVNLLQSEGNRPFPYDDLMQMVSFCGDQLQSIVSAPRYEIVKVDKMARPYRVRNTGAKTMNWLGKQPGKTIKEKLSGKEKMLTQMNAYSFDIRENQIAMMLYRQLSRRVADRVKYGIKKNGYDTVASSELAQLQKIKKQIRNSPLAEVKPQNHSQANNVLLSDKNYSIIWRAYLDMAAFDRTESEKWNRALALFAKAVFLSVNAEILSYRDVCVVEELIRPDGDHLNASYIIGCHQALPCIVDTEWKDNRISVKIQDVPCNEATRRNTEKNIGLTITQNPDAGCLQSRRGTPIIVIVGEKKTEKSLYADFSGVADLVSFLVDEIFASAQMDMKKDDRDLSRIEGSLAFDIVTNGDLLGTENPEEPIVDRFYAEKAVTFSNKGIVTVFAGREKGLYSRAESQIYVRDSIASQNNEGLKAALSDLKRRSVQSSEDYLFYLLPDALEEILQKNLKQTVRTWFPHAFPVWRSVSALTYWLSLSDAQFAPDDIFVYIDLVGDAATAGMLTIHEEKLLKDYSCSHFPPLPQSEAGETITDEAFCRRYVDCYCSSRELNFEENVREGLVRTGAVKRLLLGDDYANFFVDEGSVLHLYQLEYDSEILSQCIDDWLSAAKKFWKSIRNRFGDERRTNHIMLLSDVVTDSFIQLKRDDDLYHIFEDEPDVDIYQCGESQILGGALVYKERLNRHLPTWTEYLPKLSLEVIKDGNYAELELIGDDVSFDVMGDDNEHLVDEKLILKAGEKEFSFPLRKQDISRKATTIDAYITDKSFPLNHDVIVSLLVRYRYGFDNSFELTLCPVDSEEKSFEQIVVEWTNTDRKMNVENIWPPATNRPEDEFVLRAIDEVKNSFEKIQSGIEKHMVNYLSGSDKSTPIRTTDSFLNRNIFKLRNIVLCDLPEAEDFLEWFIKQPIYTYLGELSGIFKHPDIPEEFFAENEGVNLDYLQGDCMQVMLSIGRYTPKEIQDHFVNFYETYNEKYRMKVMVDMLLRNGSNRSGIEAVINDIKDVQNDDKYSVKMDGLVKELGRMCCFDSDLIYDFYAVDPAFIHEMIEFTVSWIRKILKRCEKYGDSYRADKKTIKRYISYMIAILGFLRLRDPDRAEGFDLLLVGSDESKQLAREIKELDDYMSREGPINPAIRFKITKPESLSKMSDLSYALDLYLNGDKKAASIEVVGVDDED